MIVHQERRQPSSRNSTTPSRGPELLQLLAAASGPRLPTCAVQQVGTYLGYSGRGANAFGKAALSP
jgi:hypothetical protein